MTDDTFNRPSLRITADQIRAFEAHVATCLQCRANVVAAWSVSMDVDETLDALCIDGITLIAARIEEKREGSRPS